MDYNFFEGDIPNKIYFRGAYYDNIEDLQLAHPTEAVNDLPSSTVPLLNQINTKDFTLQEASPLKDAGDDGRQIGYGKVAKVTAAVIDMAIIWSAFKLEK